MARNRRGILGKLLGLEDRPTTAVRPEAENLPVPVEPQTNQMPEVNLRAGLPDAQTPDIEGALGRIQLDRRGFMEGVRGALAAARMGGAAGRLVKNLALPEVPVENISDMDDIAQLFRRQSYWGHQHPDTSPRMVHPLRNITTGLFNKSRYTSFSNDDEEEALKEIQLRFRRIRQEAEEGREYRQPYINNPDFAHLTSGDGPFNANNELNYSLEDAEARALKLIRDQRTNRLTEIFGSNTNRSNESEIIDNQLRNFISSIQNPMDRPSAYSQGSDLRNPLDIEAWYKHKADPQNNPMRRNFSEEDYDKYIDEMITKLAVRTGFSENQINHWLQQEMRRSPIGDYIYGNPEEGIGSNPDWAFGRTLLRRFGENPEDTLNRQEMFRLYEVNGEYWDPPEPEPDYNPTYRRGRRANGEWEDE